MSNSKIKIRKIGDKEILGCFSQLITELGFEKISYSAPILGLNVNESKDSDWIANESIVDLSQINLMQVASINLWVNKEIKVDFARDLNANDDFITISTLPNNTVNQKLVLKSLAVVKSVFSNYESPVWKMDALPLELKDHYLSREQYLGRQEQKISELFDKMVESGREQQKEQNAKLDQLEQKYIEKAKDLDEKYEKRRIELEARESDFANMRSAFDLVEARGKRRQLREDQKKELQSLINTYKLSDSTSAKRKPVWYASIIPAGIFIFLSLMFMICSSSRTPSGDVDIVYVLRQFLFAFTGIGFIWYFIRWSNKWFQQHADEEVRLLRLSLDLDRASWLFEMLLDWWKETRTEFDKDLLISLSRNLYNLTDNNENDKAKLDALDAIFGSATNIKVGASGTKFEFDRKGVKSVAEKLRE